MSIADFRKSRNMPFVKRGMRVFCSYIKRWGRIAGVNSSNNLNIILDGERHSGNYHPWFEMQYYDKNGKLIKAYGRTN